jgi:hypothetical protein
MTNMMESRGATLDEGAGHGVAAVDGELASLVRSWMSAGRSPERLRREGLLRVAPVAPELVEPQLPTEPVVADRTDVDLIEAGDPETEAPAARPTPRTPALPHRPTAEEAEAARRVAVLIDARRVSEDVAAGLLARLSERGPVNVCRAYADWSRADLGAWVGRLRRQGLHSFHQFADDDDQALVAMAIDAVDIARDAAIDEIVIAGDMTSMLPLVHRLHAAGVRVVVVGPGHTPHDVRAACDEFLDADVVGGHEPVAVGRHRAH